MDVMVLLTALLVVLVSLAGKMAYQTISCYWLTPRRIRKIMAAQGVHGPDPRPLVGNIPDMSAMISKSTADDMSSVTHDTVGRLMPHYVAWSKQYGKRFIMWNGTEPRMCLVEPEMIKQLFSKNSSLCGKSWLQQQGSKHFIGNGLLMVNGENWYHQRHIVAPAFIGDKLKSYAGIMVECTQTLIQSLQTELNSGRTEFEISEYMKQLTADIISRTEFDTNYQQGKQIFHLLTLLQRLCAESSRRLCLPGSRFFPSHYNRQIKSLKTEVERLLMEIIHSRKNCAELGRTTSYGNDLLGMLLNQMHTKRDDGFSLSLQVIMDECKTFFFAGHETTSLLLTWSIMLLATNPAWQEKVRSEVKQVCNGGTPTADHLSKLTVLNMVINETMRLYPPATVLPRMAFEDIKLGDLHIPKGLSLWVPVLAIHHSQELWGKDADEFRPERFEAKPFAGGRFMPFAGGQRNCIGQGFAMMEAKIILGSLIGSFRFTLSEKYRHAPVTVLTIQPKYGVQVCLHPLSP